MARRALGPAALSLVAAVVDGCDADRPWLVGCSGGADSFALAVAAGHAARRVGTTVRAVVVDHSLQPGSAEIAAATVAGLSTHDVPAVVVAVDADGPGGPEASARDARHRALDDAATPDDALVLLGHTLDDQAETVLLGLARGSGARSLAGMASRRGRIVRPLLGLTRATTRQACREWGLSWWDDPHNDDPAYARSRVRHRSLPALEADLGPGVTDALARTARLLRDDADLLDALAVDLAEEVAAPDGAALDAAALAGRPPALRRRVLRDWLRRHGARDLGEDHLRAVDALLVDWHGQGPIDLPGVRVVRRRDRLGVAPGSD